MKILSSLLMFGSLNLAAIAAPQTFDFKDPKGVNNVVFKTDAPLESINGTATGISGSVVFDAANPAALKGKIVVAASSLHVPNPMMQKHLDGDQWLDVAKYPEITFETTSVAKVKTDGNLFSAEVTGKMAIHGVTNQITVPVKLTYLPGKLSARFPNLKGDLLVLRTRFIVKRSEYDINKSAPADKVSDEIELSLSLAGQSPQP